jgi:hypothetical protein
LATYAGAYHYQIINVDEATVQRVFLEPITRQRDDVCSLPCGEQTAALF